MKRYVRDPFKKSKVENIKNLVERVGKQLNVVDGFADQDFARSSKGWILSDIALLQRAATQQELDYALSRLREVAFVSADNSGKTVQEILSDILPRFVQTPAELSRYACVYANSTLGNDVVVDPKQSKLRNNDVVVEDNPNS